MNVAAARTVYKNKCFLEGSVHTLAASDIKIRGLWTLMTGLQNAPLQHKIFPTSYDINSPSIIITLSHWLEAASQATPSGGWMGGWEDFIIFRYENWQPDTQALKGNWHKHKNTLDCKESLWAKSTLCLVSPSVIASHSNSRSTRLCNNMGDGIWPNCRGWRWGGEFVSVWLCECVCVCTGEGGG